jgi:Xaa-Pro aminopeptidase
MYDLDSVGDQSRLTVLARAGELARPGLVLLAPSNLYLSGRPLPVAIVDERVRLSTRLEFAFLGRSLNDAVSGLRPVKGETELEALRRAARITSLAFQDIEPLIRPGVSEGEIERRIVQSYVEHGATGVAFKSIVGSGAHPTLPPYDANRAVMTEGLVVIDIGCSVGGYASDMTRTFSVNGEYTTAQKHLIDTVIEAGDAARAQLAPGVSMRRVGAAAREVIEGAGFGPYFTHGIGHHVGLQVHDPRRDPLEPGMVITIEPGVYIPDGADTDPSYWNLGVRVEDTYIVTDSGWEEITDYPKRPYGE